MADISEVNGVFGGVELGTIGGENNGAEGVVNGVNFGGNIDVVSQKSNLPTKTGFWSKFKAVMFQDIPWNHEIKVVLTPYQQKVEDEINEFLHQEITWEKVHDFLFQEISFGKKKRA
ncbi:MAG: hypothetical protein J5881_01685 [Clostridia bacterium]|nr:hypothetical protein [Clostridia bacterium]